MRIIAATNQKLEKLVEQKAFRDDLYYRLNVVTVDLPPLRERGDDIFLLAKFFLSRYAKEHGKDILGFTRKGTTAVREYTWPGNVREMEHKIQRAVIMTEEPYISPDDLDLAGEQSPKRKSLREVREDAEQRFLWEVMDRTGGNISLAAREMGISRGTLYDLLKKYKMRHLSEN